MRFVSWNVNGIRAIHKKGFTEIIRELGSDILLIQETKAQYEQIPEELLNLKDYSNFFVSAERKGYSGVAAFSKKTPKSVIEGFGIDEYDSEGRTIGLEFENFTIFNIYFPNGKSSSERLEYKMSFYYDFLNYLNVYRKKQKNIIICGDVNTAHKEIDLSRPKENEKTSGFLPKERKWIDDLLSDGFIDSLRLFNNSENIYTWWDLKTKARERNVGWRIDYFFVSESLKTNLSGAGVLNDIYGSDHCPVYIDINI